MIDIKALSWEEEVAIIEEGLKSPFWEVLAARYSHLAFTAGGAALSERVEHRDWMAGKATGLKEALQYPGNRVRDLKRTIKSKPEGKQAPSSTPL
jgi:hypothetical protein